MTEYYEPMIFMCTPEHPNTMGHAWCLRKQMITITLPVALCTLKLHCL